MSASRPKVLLAALVALSCPQLSCSLLLDTSAQQCNTDRDCSNRGGRFASAACVNHVCVPHTETADSGSDAADDGSESDANSDPVWGCLGKVVWGAPSSLTVKVTIPFLDLIRKVPITDVAVRACANKLDVMCGITGMPPVDADGDGFVRLEVPAPFAGYGQVLPASTVDAGAFRWMPSIIFFNPPLVRDTTYDQIPLLQPDDIRALAAVQGNSIDPESGMVFAGMLDCSGKPAAGVIWEPSRADANSKQFNYINGFPDEAAVATDASGFGGVTNLRPGTITITARVLATGKPIGSATILVRAGFASYTYVAPSP